MTTTISRSCERGQADLDWGVCWPEDDAGIRMLVPHPLQRTVLPRADVGTARTFLQVRFGHITRRLDSLLLIAPSPVSTRPLSF